MFNVCNVDMFPHTHTSRACSEWRSHIVEISVGLYFVIVFIHTDKTNCETICTQTKKDSTTPVVCRQVPFRGHLLSRCRAFVLCREESSTLCKMTSFFFWLVWEFWDFEGSWDFCLVMSRRKRPSLTPGYRPVGFFSFPIAVSAVVLFNYLIFSWIRDQFAIPFCRYDAITADCLCMLLVPCLPGFAPAFWYGMVVWASGECLDVIENRMYSFYIISLQIQTYAYMCTHVNVWAHHAQYSILAANKHSNVKRDWFSTRLNRKFFFWLPGTVLLLNAILYFLGLIPVQ